MNQKVIPLSVPDLKGSELKYVATAVIEEWVSTRGPYVNQFEETIAEYVHTKGAVACQNGTSGLHTALIAAGVSEKDAVIVPTLTFIAAVNPVKYIGAEPIFMDCDDSLCMDTAKLRRFCEEECSFNLTVIEDATEALGSFYTDGEFTGKYAGTIGDMEVYFFNGNKIITTGSGGMIVSNDEKKLRHAKHLTTQAKSDDLYYPHDEIGYNYWMTNLQAAPA